MYYKHLITKLQEKNNVAYAFFLIYNQQRYDENNKKFADAGGK